MKNINKLKINNINYDIVDSSASEKAKDLQDSITNLKTGISSLVDSKNQANGLATLNNTGYLQQNQIPQSILTPSQVVKPVNQALSAQTMVGYLNGNTDRETWLASVYGRQFCTKLRPLSDLGAYNSYSTGIYAGNKFVIGTKTSSIALITSTDGVTWTLNDAFASFSEISLIRYFSGTWVMVDNLYKKIHVSADLTTWTHYDFPSYIEEIKEIYKTPSYYVFLTTTGIHLTTNFQTYTPAIVLSASNNITLTYDVKYFARSSDKIVVAFENSICTSTDGYTWSQTYPSIISNIVDNSGVFSALTYGSGRFIAIYNCAMGSSGIITTSRFSSTDGTSWSLKSLNALESYSPKEMIYHNGLFLGYGSSGGSDWYTNDGSHWGKINKLDFNKIVYGNGLWLGFKGSTIRASTDGIIWHPRISFYDSPILDILFGTNTWVIVTSNSIIQGYVSNLGVLLK